MTLPTLGQSLGSLPVKLERVRVLEYYDGELLVEEVTPSGDPYLRSWFDTDREGTTRWLVFRVRRESLVRFVGGMITLRAVLEDVPDGFVYVEDANSNGSVRTTLCLVGDLPRASMPEADSFHDSALEPVVNASDPVFVLDGNWDLEHLVHIDRRYQDAYAFNSVFASDSVVPAEAVTGRFTHQRMDVGWHNRLAFDQVRRLIPKNNRLGSQSLSYQSPGFLMYQATGQTVLSIQAALSDFIQNRQASSHIYNRLHRVLLLVESGKASADDLRAVNAELPALVRNLIAALAGLSQERVLSAVAHDQLQAAQMVAAYYRRLEDLARAAVSSTRRARLVGVDEVGDKAKSIKPSNE